MRLSFSRHSGCGTSALRLLCDPRVRFEPNRRDCCSSQRAHAWIVNAGPAKRLASDSRRPRHHRMTSKSLRDQLIVGLASAVVLAGALASTHPIYMARAEIVRRLFAHEYVDSTTLRAPCLLRSSAVALRTPQSLPDR